MCKRGCQAGCSLFWCFVYLFLGLVILAEGIRWAVTPFVYYTKVMEHPDLSSGDVVWQGWVGGLVAVGVFCVVVGILGMIGSGCESKGTIIAFMVLGSIGTIACLVMAGLATSRYVTNTNKYVGDKDQTELIDIFANNLAGYYTNENATDNDFVDAWNKIQSRTSCCGMRNYRDYENTTFVSDSGFVAPWSCCRMRDNEAKWDAKIDGVADLAACRLEAANPPAGGIYANFYPEGCEEDVIWRYGFNDIFMLGLGWGVVFFQIITLIVSGCLKEDLKISSYVV